MPLHKATDRPQGPVDVEATRERLIAQARTEGFVTDEIHDDQIAYAHRHDHAGTSCALKPCRADAISKGLFLLEDFQTSALKESVRTLARAAYDLSRRLESGADEISAARAAVRDELRAAHACAQATCRQATGHSLGTPSMHEDSARHDHVVLCIRSEGAVEALRSLSAELRALDSEIRRGSLGEVGQRSGKKIPPVLQVDLYRTLRAAYSWADVIRLVALVDEAAGTEEERAARASELLRRHDALVPFVFVGPSDDSDDVRST